MQIGPSHANLFFLAILALLHSMLGPDNYANVLIEFLGFSVLLHPGYEMRWMHPRMFIVQTQRSN
jgi:hypothetical protein